MADKAVALKEVLGMEGGHSDRADDAGGATTWGVTEKVARSHPYNYEGEMKNLSRDLAIRIYTEKYWNKIKGDKINDQAVANELFESGVNCGIGSAVLWLQRVLNAFNRYERDWTDIDVDGICGSITIQTLNIAVKKRKDNILKALNVLQGYHYITLAENPKRRDAANINGWYAHRIALSSSEDKSKIKLKDMNEQPEAVA